MKGFGLRQDKSSIFVILLAILACFLWSTAFAGIKIGLKYTPPFSFAGFRFMISGLMLAPFWLGRTPFFSTIREHYKHIVTVAFFQTALLYGLFYYSIAMIPSALAAIMVGASPLTTAITAHFFASNDKLSKKKLISLGIGVIGVAIITLSRKPWASATGFSEFLGIAILLISGVSSAIGNIYVSKSRAEINPLFLTSVQIFFGGFLLFLLSLPLEGPPKVITEFEYYAALLWLSAISAAAFSLWFILLRRPDVKVSDLNLWKFLIPVSGAILSWILIPEESPTIFAISGMLCIAGSIVLFNKASTISNKEASEVLPNPASERKAG